jgi:nucleoside-diphosphate-sugar epimerase
MKILVIGGTGLLSSPFVEFAMKKSMEVFMINRGISGMAQKGVCLLKADIQDRKTVLSLVNSLYFDAVLDFISYNEAHLENSLSLFGDKTKQFIFISSYAVYNTLLRNCCDEDSPTWLEAGGNRYWCYGLNKCKCEVLLKKDAGERNIAYTVIRPAVTYGNTRIPYGFAPRVGYHGTLIERVFHGKPIITWNNGENRINITHVDDFSAGLVGLIGNSAAYNEVFNLTGDEIPSWQEVLNTLSEALNIKIKTVDMPVEYLANMTVQKDDLLWGRSISAVCVNTKIKAAVGDFKQNVSLKEGIKRIVDHYLDHREELKSDYAFDGENDRIVAKYIKGFNLHCMQYNKMNTMDKFKYVYFRHKDCAGISLLNTVRKNILPYLILI